MRNGQRLLVIITCTYRAIYILNVGLFNEYVSDNSKLNISLQEHMFIDHCTYLGIGLLETPRENVLHGPLLGIYWLRLCPHFRVPTLEARLLRRRLFMVLMTAAHISPTVFSLQLFLASMYWTSRYNIQQCMHTYYTLHSHILYYITLYYITRSHPSCIYISSVLPDRLAALGSLRPYTYYYSAFVPLMAAELSLWSD
jgi:hypothetical protein